MKSDDDKTRTHIVLTKATTVPHFGWLLIVVSLTALPAGVLWADDSIPDTTLPSFSHLAEMTQRRSGDSGRFSFSLGGLAATGSDEIKTGYGIGFALFYNGIKPLVPTIGFDLFISSLNVEGLPVADFVSASPTLDLTVRRTSGKLRPYAGVGINLHFNQLNLDEPEDVSISGYDSTTQAKQIDMGWGVAPHLRLGLIVPVGKRLGVIVEGRFMTASHSADIEYHDRLTGDDWRGSLDYDMPTVWLTLGIVRDP